MRLTDALALGGIIVSIAAIFVSVGVLLQMKQDTKLARKESELRIRPILFVKDVNISIKDDEIQSIDVTVVNSGLGPALNVRAKIGEDVSLPGTGASLRSTIFEESNIVQVLPNTSAVYGSANTTFNVTSGGTVTLVGGISGLPQTALQSTSILRIPVVRRPDGQAQLRLPALSITKEELLNAISDALFITQATSMTNVPISYRNRPKRSDTIEELQ